MGSDKLYIHCKSCGKTFLKKYSNCSHCGAKLNKFTWWKIGLFLLGILSISSILNPSEKPSLKISDRPNISKTIQKVPETHPIPIDQKKFMQIVNGFSIKFKNAKNEIQQSSTKDRRKESISNILQNRTIYNWEGTVSSLKTTSSGDAILEVALSKKITIKTWNNSLSDIGSNTIIKKESNLYARLWDLSEGDGVVVTGNFMPSETDYIHETSLTIKGSMQDPDFLFHFTNVTKNIK